MGRRVLTASATTVPSTGSTVRFPASGNVWNDRDVTGVDDVRIMASLSASSNYTIRLVGSFTDPDSGSTMAGVVESFGPGDTLGDGAGAEAFRSAGPHTHFEWVEIETSSASDLTVNELGVIWESA